jgi:hypothetical protein
MSIPFFAIPTCVAKTELPKHRRMVCLGKQGIVLTDRGEQVGLIVTYKIAKQCELEINGQMKWVDLVSNPDIAYFSGEDSHKEAIALTYRTVPRLVLVNPSEWLRLPIPVRVPDNYQIKVTKICPKEEL